MNIFLRSLPSGLLCLSMNVYSTPDFLLIDAHLLNTYLVKEVGMMKKNYNWEKMVEFNFIPNNRTVLLYPVTSSPDMYQSMIGSVMGGLVPDSSAGEAIGVDMTASIIAQAEENTSAQRTEVDGELYPALAELVKSQEKLCTMTGVFPERMLEDLNTFVSRHLQTNRNAIEQWFRWFVGTNVVYAVKNIYRNEDKNWGGNDTPDEGRVSFGNQIISQTFEQMSGLRRLMNLLSKLNIGEQYHVKIISNFMMGSIEGSFGISVFDQPTVILLGLLFADTNVFNSLVQDNALTFNRDRFYRSRVNRRHNYPSLHQALDINNRNLAANDMIELSGSGGNEKVSLAELMSDATIHVLRREAGFLRQFSYSHSDVPIVRPSLQHSSGDTVISDDLLRDLEAYASTHPEQASSVIVSLLHMPHLISILQKLKDNEKNLTRVFNWIAEHHNQLLTETGQAWQIPVLETALLSLYRDPLGADAPPVHQQLVNTVTAWTTAVDSSLNPNLIATTLIQEYPNLFRSQSATTESGAAAVSGERNIKDLLRKLVIRDPSED